MRSVVCVVGHMIGQTTDTLPQDCFPAYSRTIPRPRFRADSEDREGGSFLPRCDRGFVEFGYVR